MPTATQLAEYGATKLGLPYALGATGPRSYDCSGLMVDIFGHFGVALPRTTYDQVHVGAEVPKGQQRPGDLIFSSWDGTPHSHVGLYVGDGKILNAPHSGATVGYATLNSTYLAHVDAIRRPLGVAVDSLSPAGAAVTAEQGDSGMVAAVRDAAGSLQSMASSAASAGRFADQVLKLALPTNLTRAVVGGVGIVLVFFGVTFLLREVRD